ncbi:hypothetical protein V6N13_118992 [Hibiscus sabdariffa]
MGPGQVKIEDIASICSSVLVVVADVLFSLFCLCFSAYVFCCLCVVPALFSVVGVRFCLSISVVVCLSGVVSLFSDPFVSISKASYDPDEYSQNFDQGTGWTESDNLSQSFSARFAHPSRISRWNVLPFIQYVSETNAEAAMIFNVKL